jgi:hypothetical protein
VQACEKALDSAIGASSPRHSTIAGFDGLSEWARSHLASVYDTACWVPGGLPNLQKSCGDQASKLPFHALLLQQAKPVTGALACLLAACALNLTNSGARGQSL